MNHTKEIIDLIDTIYFVARLSGYTNIIEHSTSNSRFLLFESKEQRIGLSYKDFQLQVVYGDQLREIPNDQGLHLQTSLLKEVMRDL